MRFLWIGLLLATLAFLLYLNTLGHGYVLDDPLAIGKNDFVRKGIAGIGDLFTHHYRSGTEGSGASALLYRPLSLVTFAIEWQLAPDSPALGHFINACWYALTTALLFAALRHTFNNYHWLWAAGTTLLFVAHPLHTEVVANIKSRDELLSLFFGIAALYSWARWLEKPVSRWLGLALGSYFLALLSKESAVTLLPAFPMVSWFFFQKTIQQSTRHGLLFILPLLFFLGIRMAVLHQTTDTFEVNELDNPIVAARGYGEHLATSFMVLWKYLQLLVFPHPLLSDYSYRHLAVENWTHWQSIAGVLAYGLLIFFALRGLSHRQPLAFCTMAFLISMALYGQFPLVIGTLLGERLMYAPSLWFCAAAALLVWKGTGFNLNPEPDTGLWPPAGRIRTGAGILLVVATLFSLKTLFRNPDWHSNLTLFRADSAKAPDNIRLHNGIGNELVLQITQGKELSQTEKTALLQEIEAHSRAAMAIRPTQESLLNLGNVAFFQNRFAEAIEQYDQALKLDPGYEPARTNAGHSYLGWSRVEAIQNNNPARAAELLEKALEYGLDNAEVHLNLGTSYGMTGQIEKAIPHLEKATQLNPQNRNAWRNLGILYRKTGNLAGAAACEQKAAEQ